MKRKPFTFTGAPRKIVASPALMAVLCRLETKHMDSVNPDRRKNVNTQGS